ncbi:hypothetical protein WJX77_006663 [Trebouxia sp. C0004]
MLWDWQAMLCNWQGRQHGPFERMNKRLQVQNGAFDSGRGQEAQASLCPLLKWAAACTLGWQSLQKILVGRYPRQPVGSVSVMKMAAGYLGKAVVASKVEKQTEKATIMPVLLQLLLNKKVWTQGRERRQTRLMWSQGSGEVPSGAKAGEPVSERKTAAGQVDFVLQDSSTENAYLAAIKAHFCNWSSYDTALFTFRAVGVTTEIQNRQPLRVHQGP